MDTNHSNFAHVVRIFQKATAYLLNIDSFQNAYVGLQSLSNSYIIPCLRERILSDHNSYYSAIS